MTIELIADGFNVIAKYPSNINSQNLKVCVTLDGVDLRQMIEAVTLDALLTEIGEQRCREYFGIEEGL